MALAYTLIAGSGGSANDIWGGSSPSPGGTIVNAAELADGIDVRVNIAGQATGSTTTNPRRDALYVVYDSSGNIVWWSFANDPSNGNSGFTIPNTNFVDGSYTLKVYDVGTNATAPTGTASATSITVGTTTYTSSSASVGSFNFSVNATPPGAPTVSLTTNSGDPNDLITNTAGLTVTGESGATIQYRTATSGSGSTWVTYSTAPTPTQGSNTLYFRQIDAAGNTSPEVTFTYTYDTQAALVTLGLVTDSGTANDNVSNVGTVEVKSGQEAGATVYYSTSENGTYTTTAPDFSGEADGTKTVWAYQVDLAGNQSAKSSYSFTLDTTPPVATLAGTRFEDNGTPEVTTDDYYLIDQSLTFTGTVDAGSSNVILTLKDLLGAVVFTHTLTTGGGQEELKADGTWTYNASAVAALQTTNGEMFTLEVNATDKAANTGTTTFGNVKIDATAPPVPSVSQFNFAPIDSRWKHDVAVLGYIGDVILTTDPTATVSAWIQNGNNKDYLQNAVLDTTTNQFVWSPTLVPGSSPIERISLSTLYQPLEWSLAAVDEAGNVITVGNGPNAKPAIVNCVYGSHAVQYGDNPATGPVLGDNPATADIVETDFLISDGVETNYVLNNINDNLVGSNDYDDLIVGYNGNDNINGQGGNDWLYGGQGDDAIQGNQGNDEIVGGTQRDVMSGGAGNDRFIYSRINESNTSALSRDQITDFTITAGVDADVINMSEISRSLMQLSFTTIAYGANGKASGQANVAVGKVWFANDGMLYANTSGNSSADFAIQLRNPADFASPTDANTEMALVRSYLATGGGLIL